MINRKLGVGIIGLGHNGEAHLRAYQTNPFTEVIAVCDLSEEKVRKIKKIYGIKYGYTDYQKMLIRKDIQVVSVNTSDHLHAKPFIHSLEAGKHTFVEKPMADTILDLRKMVEAADKNPHLKTMIGQILRFNPLFKKIKEFIRKGTLGEIFYLEGDYIHNLKCQADKERYNEKIGMNWWLEKELPMVGGGCHPLDLLRWFAGGVVEVQAYSNRIAFPQMKNDDAVVAIFKFENSCLGKVTALYGPVSPYAYANNIAVYGTKGTILRDTICLDEKEGFTKIEVPYSRGHPYEPEVNHFIECILKDKKPLVDAREGARTAAAAITINKALKEKKSIPIPEF